MVTLLETENLVIIQIGFMESGTCRAVLRSTADLAASRTRPLVSTVSDGWTRRLAGGLKSPGQPPKVKTELFSDQGRRVNHLRPTLEGTHRLNVERRRMADRMATTDKGTADGRASVGFSRKVSGVPTGSIEPGEIRPLRSTGATGTTRPEERLLLRVAGALFR